MVNIPVVVNGGIFSAHDSKRAFDETGADGVMIARGAIQHPWIFKESKMLIEKGIEPSEISPKERIETALKHLRYEIQFREIERQAVIPFRKYYTGYLKGLHHSSSIRQKLMEFVEYDPIEDLLLTYLSELELMSSDE